MGTVSNLLLTGARTLVAPTGEALPDETSVAYGASWGGNWVDVGFTQAPLRVTYNESQVGISPQQALGNVKKFRVGETARAATTLGEVNGVNLALLLPGSASNTAAGSGQKGFTEFSLGGSLTVVEKIIGFEGYRLDSAGTQQPVRVFFWKAVLTLTGDIVFGKSEQMTLGMAIEALEDQGKSVGNRLLAIQIVTAPAT